MQTQPVATGETVTAFGNVRISTTNGAPNLLANDCDPDDTAPPCNSSLTASGPTTGPTSGQATVSSNGDFTYNPNPGFTGTDTFTYTVRDTGPDGTPGNADDKTDTATVSITVGPTLIWFIDNTAAGGRRRAHHHALQLHRGLQRGRGRRPRRHHLHLQRHGHLHGRHHAAEHAEAHRPGLPARDRDGHGAGGQRPVPRGGLFADD